MGPLSKQKLYKAEGGAVAVDTGIPQGGHAKSAIDIYLSGSSPVKSSYVPDAHSQWLAQVQQQASDYADQYGRGEIPNPSGGSGGAGVPPLNPYAPDSHLRVPEMDAAAKTIGSEMGIPNYNPYEDVIWDETGGKMLTDKANDAAEYINMNVKADSASGGTGSLISGDYSGASTKFNDVASDVLGIAGKTMIGKAIGVDAPSTADRVGNETEAYAAAVKSGEKKKFDMNDPSTWTSPSAIYETKVTKAEDTFGSDLSRSLTDPNYDPPGTVLSRALGITKTDDDGGGSSDSSSSKSSGGYGCYVSSALVEDGLWTHQKKARLVSWCMKAKPEGKFDTHVWRNGYVWWGKSVIAPKANSKIVQWMSNGFYNYMCKKERSVQSIMGMLFFYIPSYIVGMLKVISGTDVPLERT